MASNSQSDSASDPPQTIAVIGGGISGMSAAYRLLKDSPDVNVILIEADDHLGGVLGTDQVGDFLVERSADMFSIEPDAGLQLCRELEMESDLLQTQPVQQRAFVSHESGIQPVPQGLALMLPNQLDSILQSKLISESGKSRFLEEETVQPRLDADDESLESFAVRRFGSEMFQQVIQPLTSGIYSADPKSLSMLATMKRFVDMEREHGSLIAAARANQADQDQNTSGARYGLFRAPAGGFQELVDRLQSAIESHAPRFQLKTGSRVTHLKYDKQAANWSIELESESTEPSRKVQGVILATAARVSARLMGDQHPKLVNELNQIENASMTIVAMGIDNAQLEKPFDGFGIVVPAIENRELIAISFSSNKFKGRCPDEKSILRCFIGGALSPEAIKRTDEELIGIACEESRRLVGLKGEPEFTRVIRWPNAMPQYHLGHLDRVAAIESATHKIAGLELAGNSYRGVGIPACIVSGFTAARRLLGIEN